MMANASNRKDWATAGLNMTIKSTGVQTPPLLHAVAGRHLDSVEFFLSDTPHRLYSEFAKPKHAREDSRLQLIMSTPGGFNNAVSNWLEGGSKFRLFLRFLRFLRFWNMEIRRKKLTLVHR